uniref:(California timema) hypothetical protein n=1 Tax=Timema californicum TaxID=61474 RepID=A0A7R9P861_TIMCA|nr:unnamed protein product [Timema californicum]
MNMKYSSPMASLVLTDSSQTTADGFEKLPDQIRYPYAEPYELQKHVFSSCQNLGYMRTRGNYNVIVVDWAIPSRDGYTTASYTSILVGGTVAKFIDYLASNGLRPSNVNIVGFSMGAHVAGTAGSRITSLDPAGPVFDLFPAGDKLTSDDADFVQVIHTNVGRFGYVGDLGHVDFYPNGGSVQNGCAQQTTLDSVLDFCNHLRSKEYYVESLTSKRVFNATMCYSWIDYSKRRCYRNPTAAMGAYTPNRF